MCGRYLITTAPEAMRQLFRYLEQPNFPARYNVAPTQPVPIVRMREGRRQFALVRWGLIPGWVKDPRKYSLIIHARAESVNEKPAFKNAMKRRRCLFPADGFYEWKEGGPRNRPFVVRPKSGELIAFAGVWECWEGPNGEEVETAALITTDANQALNAVHHRMPVVIAPEDFGFWLDCANVDAEKAATLLKPAPEDQFEAYEISTAVNRVVNDGPDLLRPAPSQPDAEPAGKSAATSASAMKPAKPARKPKSDTRQPSLF